MHPDDAAARGIADGDVVRVFNDRGACLAGARAQRGLRRGVVQLVDRRLVRPVMPASIGRLDKHGNPNVLTLDMGTSARPGLHRTDLPGRDRALRRPGEPPPVTAHQAAGVCGALGTRPSHLLRLGCLRFLDIGAPPVNSNTALVRRVVCAVACACSLSLARRDGWNDARFALLSGFRLAARLPDVAAFIARCEDAGFDGVGIHDHPSSGRDAYLALALAAQATQRLRLFPATSSPVVRHPLVLASLAHSLEEIAPGRAFVSLWPPASFRRAASAAARRRGVMREAISDLRRLLAGEEVAFGPTSTRLRNRSATPTPVYLLAAGPRMIELAGEVADGAFLMVGLHPASVRAARRHLEAGASGPGARWPASPWYSWSRSVSAPMPTSAHAGCGVGSRQDNRSWPIRASPIFAGSREAGFDLGTAHDPVAIPEDRARQIADAFGLFGSPEHCAERLLRAREEAGIEDVFLFPAHDLAGGYTMPEAQLQAFARVIRPRLERG